MATILSGCATITPHDVDKYGFKWERGKYAATECLEIQVPDLTLVCGPKTCACTKMLVKNSKVLQCTIYYPINPHPDIVEHERRHRDGWIHAPHKGITCPSGLPGS